MSRGLKHVAVNVLKTSWMSVFAAVVILLFAGCGSKSTAPEKRFALHGKIVSVNLEEQTAVVDHDAIPGFMDAMTMSYAVPDSRALSTLGPGDEIKADMVVADSVPHLENIVVVKRPGKPDPASSSSFRMPQPGDSVPDFVLVDQDGKRIHLRSFRGRALLMTFIYTRCPFADFCPKVSDAFAHVYAALDREPALHSRVRLLSVSFDPSHDTPAVLRQYAASFRDTTETTRPFDRWEFATAPTDELPRMARFFGLYYNEQNGQITHSMSTSLISPAGKIVEWFNNNDWKPEAVLAEASAASAPSQPLQQQNTKAKQSGKFGTGSENRNYRSRDRRPRRGALSVKEIRSFSFRAQG